MPDELSVYNAALLEIGHTPLTSTDDTSSAGVQCRAHYADTRDATLELHPWNFATAYATLARSGTTPAMRWKYQYPLPTGAGVGQPPYCLAVRETDQGIGTRWAIGSDKNDGRVLFSNESSLAIGYTARVEDLGQWSRVAIQVLIKMLASKLAKPLTGQLDVEEAKLKEALGLVPAGAERDARETGGSALQVIDNQDTTLALANEAIGELGLPAIADFNEQTVLAQHLRTQFAGARDATLELSPWPFARFQATLTASNVVPAFKWTKQYRLPTEPYCLTVLGTDLGARALYEVGESVPDGRVLLTNATSVKVEYLGRVIDLAQWNTLARQVLVKVWASKVAQALAAQAVGPQQEGEAPRLASLARTKWDEALALLPVAVRRHRSELQPATYRTNNEAITTTATQIAQRALSELGEAPLADIEELTVVGFACRLQLAAARDAVLELHPWNFAKKQAALAALPRAPQFKWDKAYLLPADCLTVLGTAGGNGAQWEIGIEADQTRVLYSNEDTVSIEYIFRQIHYALWSALVVDVLVKTLAARIAAALARDLLRLAEQLGVEMSATLHDEARVLLALGPQKATEAQVLLRDARDRDAREGYPVVLTPNRTLVSVRGGGSRLGSIWEAAHA